MTKEKFQQAREIEIERDNLDRFWDMYSRNIRLHPGGTPQQILDLLAKQEKEMHSVVVYNQSLLDNQFNEL